MDRRAATIPGPRVLGYVLLLGAGLLLWLLATAAPSHTDDSSPLGGGVSLVGDVVADVTERATAIADVPSDAKTTVAETTQSVVVTTDEHLGTISLVGPIAEGGRGTVGHALPGQAKEVVVPTTDAMDDIEAGQTAAATSDSAQQISATVTVEQDAAPTWHRNSRAPEGAVAEGRAAAKRQHTARSASVSTTGAILAPADRPETTSSDRSTGSVEGTQANPVTGRLLFGVDRDHAVAGVAGSASSGTGSCDSSRLALPATDGVFDGPAVEHNAAESPALLPAASPD
ncbi:hypothetical protein [Nocardioides sp. InS609-2]|uniref:hypothetical protein n=1 Tax=Nocardioides sp. InS609-2 TaxID=2760705 RepID=UPI0020C029FC|nr:hypothetical protein [Nocardioides sp. InS609-2]